MIIRCPLCQKLESKSVSVIANERIWSSLEADSGVAIGQDVIARHTLASNISLLECLNCGLQYFSPALPGDSDFYSQLTSSAPTYYSVDKWDFRAAAKFVSTGNVVLDIACGDGKFLQLARSKGADVCGIDTNPTAVERAKLDGLPVHCTSLYEFASEYHGCFDVVTAFQVVEHLAEVQPFVRAAMDCLKPGGKLLLSLPNRLRLFRAPFEPFDHPPHHLTRWTANQFQEIAQQTGLKIISIHYEPGRMGDCRALLRGWIAPGRQTESLWARAVARLVFGPSMHKLFARLGWLERWPLWGMSMMAVLEK